MATRRAFLGAAAGVAAAMRDDGSERIAAAGRAVSGRTPRDLASDFANLLFDRHRIIVTPLAHEEFDGIRVTPGVYTTADEVDRFAAITQAVIEKGRPG